MKFDDRFNELLNEVGRLVDILVMDEYPDEHFWHLALDRDTLVFAEIDEKRGVLMLSCDVGSVRPSEQNRLYELFLRYNHGPAAQYGTYLSLASASGPVWLWCECSVATLDRTSLADTLATFRRKASGWKMVVEGRTNPEVMGRPEFMELASGSAIRV